MSEIRISRDTPCEKDELFRLSPPLTRGFARKEREKKRGKMVALFVEIIRFKSARRADSIFAHTLPLPVTQRFPALPAIPPSRSLIFHLLASVALHGACTPASSIAARAGCFPLDAHRPGQFSNFNAYIKVLFLRVATARFTTGRRNKLQRDWRNPHSAVSSRWQVDRGKSKNGRVRKKGERKEKRNGISCSANSSKSTYSQDERADSKHLSATSEIEFRMELSSSWQRRPRAINWKISNPVTYVVPLTF